MTFATTITDAEIVAYAPRNAHGEMPVQGQRHMAIVLPAQTDKTIGKGILEQIAAQVDFADDPLFTNRNDREVLDMIVGMALTPIGATALIKWASGMASGETLAADERTHIPAIHWWKEYMDSTGDVVASVLLGT